MTRRIDLRRAVEFAVTTEQLGQSWYEKLAAKFEADGEIAGIFRRLARDEKTHEQQFRSILARVPEGGGVGGDEGHDVLRAMAVSEFFTDREDLEGIAAAIGTREDALGKALAFEKATLGYYRSLQDVLGDEPALGEIVEAEKEHISALARYLLTDAEFRGLGDPFAV